MEVAAGLEPAKSSFAGCCLDRFGIATKSVVPKTHTQTCTQNRHLNICPNCVSVTY
jgi:hypothetical protein